MKFHIHAFFRIKSQCGPCWPHRRLCWNWVSPWFSRDGPTDISQDCVSPAGYRPHTIWAEWHPEQWFRVPPREPTTLSSGTTLRTIGTLGRVCKLGMSLGWRCRSGRICVTVKGFMATFCEKLGSDYKASSVADIKAVL